MKRSEKILLSLFAIIFVVLVGGGVARMAITKYNDIVEETETLQQRLVKMQQTVAQGSDWQKRADWVEANAPKFGGHEEATAKLFEAALKEATSAGLKAPTREFLPPPQVKEGESEGYFDKASVKLTFNDASEEQLFKWMHQVYSLKRFIGITRMSMTPNAQGKSVNCEVDVTQFYRTSSPQKLSKN